METLAFLDTHLIVWLYAGEAGLISPAARKLIDEARIFISPMSLLEVDYLHEIKRITVGGRRLFEDLNQRIQLELADDPFADVVAGASRLSWTRDPFDRLIVAHASCRQAPLITKDRLLRRHYHCVW